MENDLVGFLIGSLEPEREREIAALLASQPEEQAKVELLRKALAPLAIDRDAFEPPASLAVRTIAGIAEHVVATEGSVADSAGSVSEFLRTLGQKDPPDRSAPKPMPAYPRHGSEAAPAQFSHRNFIAALGLSAVMLLIGVTAVMTMRQVRDVQTCANNMRVINTGLNTWCDLHGDRYPQVNPNEDVRTAFERIQRDGVLPANLLYCPGSGYDRSAPTMPIDYAYTLGYRDHNGDLVGVTRNESDQFAILADAPERRGNTTIPLNHRKGQNVLFKGGNVRFCTNPNVGPEGDDIYFNTIQEPHAGTQCFDVALGKSNDQP